MIIHDRNAGLRRFSPFGFTFPTFTDNFEPHSYSGGPQCIASRVVASNCVLRIALLLVGCLCSLAASGEERKEASSPGKSVEKLIHLPPPPQSIERTVIAAFSKVHNGWSVDEVLLQDELRTIFLQVCRSSDLTESQVDSQPERVAGSQSLSEPSQSIPISDDMYCSALIHVRKAGGRLPKATRRAAGTNARNAQSIQRSSGPSGEQLTAISEIAARRMADELGCHTDAILSRDLARERYDQLVLSLWPEGSVYDFRKAALRLRKTRRLRPELLARVTDWHLSIRDFKVAELRANVSQVPNRPGIYLFRDNHGYQYIGQAKDLRKRLSEHLQESDRKGLATFLSSAWEANERVYVEVHVFEAGSPGVQLAIRRAYESELIRSRKPKLNLAP